MGSTDGFELAEIDLELRGEGTIMGERQKGSNDLRLASLRRDKDVVALARQVAIDLLEYLVQLVSVDSHEKPTVVSPHGLDEVWIIRGTVAIVV